MMAGCDNKLRLQYVHGLIHVNFDDLKNELRFFKIQIRCILIPFFYLIFQVYIKPDHFVVLEVVKSCIHLQRSLIEEDTLTDTEKQVNWFVSSRGVGTFVCA